MRIGFLTSCEERCGIAAYSRRLVAALRAAPERAEIEIVPAGFRRAARAEYAAMGRALSRGDVAHVQHAYAFFGGMHPLRCGWSALAGAICRPLLVTVHELDPSGASVPRDGAAREVLLRAFKRRFNRAVFLHPAVRRWMVHAAPLREALIELGAPAERVHYRPLPIAPAPPAPDPAPLRQSLGLGEEARPLVIPGFLARRKGYTVALEALRRLPEPFVLVAAGGEHPADRTGTAAWLRAEAERRGVGGRLRITGFLSDTALEQAFALAELVLAPFLDMSASASLNDALARGKAVVASDLPENRRLGCVRLFPTGDAGALAAAIRELAAEPAARAALGEAARRYAEGHSYAALAAETLALYQELLQEAKIRS